MKCKDAQKLLNGFRELCGHCVDSIGLPKKPTAKQLHKAVKLIYEFERKLKEANL